MMREVYHCEMCGEETGLHINGTPYCMDHVLDGAGVQARLVASLSGMSNEEVREWGAWMQAEMAAMLGLG
jgi:hypothetical protein